MGKKPKAQPKSFNTVKYCDRDMCGASVAVWGPGCVQGPCCCRLTLTVTTLTKHAVWIKTLFLFFSN